MIKVGQPAPSFKAQAYVNGDFKEVSLEDYRGKWTVLFFYPLDFTFVCPTELKAFSDAYSAFQEAGAEVMACSIDSVYSHKAWFEKDLPDVKYPVLSDMTKTISRDYNVLNEEKGIANRGAFIIDPDGILKFYTVTDLGVGRNTDEILRVLQATQSGGLCPANWKPGDAHLKA